MNPTLRVINNFSEFSGLRDMWNDLLKRSAADTIFLTWEWIYTWWECFGESKKLFIIIAENDGSIVGIAPLYITKARFLGILKLKHLEFLGTNGALTEYMDFIIFKGYESEIVPAFLNFIFEQSLQWDVLNLVSVRQDALNLKLIKIYCNKKKLRYQEYNSNISPYIKLPASFDEYMQSLSRNSRWRFKKHKKNLEKGRKVEVFETKDQSSVSEDFSKIIQLHQKRWEQKGGKGSFSNTKAQFIQFHKSIVQRFFVNGWLYLTQLQVEGESVAGQYNFFYNDIVYYHSVGFDPQWAEFNIGSVLQLLVLEDSINKGAKEFDFLRGTEQYKYIWAKNKHISVDIAIWKNQFLANRTFFERRIRKIIKKIIPKYIANKIYCRFIARDN
jgi:CelD/BcsL family acetyltransferase involved in cellulose biosynthesis